MIMQYLSDNYILFITEVMAMIAEKIKLLRESKNMTQTDIAKKLGITRKYLLFTNCLVRVI